MSLVNVFGFLFESEGAEKVSKEIKELTKQESVAEDQAKKLSKEQDNLDKNNKNLIKSVVALTASYLGFKKVLNEVFSFASGGEELLLMANSAGIGAEKLERYGRALENYGGSLSSASATFKSINQSLQDLKFGKGGAIQDAAIRYGLDVGGSGGLATAEEFLINVARRMESLDGASQLDLGRKLGLDESTIALLQQGVAGLNQELERAAKLSIYKPEDLENARKFQIELREFRASIQRLWGSISTTLMPVLTKLFNGVGGFFDKLSRHTTELEIGIGVIGALLVSWGAKVMIAWSPILTVLAGIAAAILMIGDFVAFLKGDKSIIGSTLGIDNALETVAAKRRELGLPEEETMTMQDYISGVVSGGGSVGKGRKAMNLAQTPLSTAYTNNSSSSNNSVKIDSVNVNTPATDVKGISQSISGALQSELDNLLLQTTGGNVS